MFVVMNLDIRFNAALCCWVSNVLGALGYSAARAVCMSANLRACSG
jgi:hypothetical protein